jgi:hypothetical protein
MAELAIEAPTVTARLMRLNNFAAIPALTMRVSGRF